MRRRRTGRERVPACLHAFCFFNPHRLGPPALPAGATSAAIKKSNSGLTQKLSGFASFAALALGTTMLLGGLGVDLPFALPALPFLGGHSH